MLDDKHKVELAQNMKSLIDTYYENLPLWMDYYEYLAKRKKMEYDALIRNGFSETQAIDLVAQVK